MDTKTVILEYIRNLPHGRATFKQLLRELPRHGVARSEIDAEIQSLIARGEIVEPRSGQFVAVGSNREYAAGRLNVHRDGFAFVTPEVPIAGLKGDIYIAKEAAARAMQIQYVRGGTYVVMEGPQFSTLAESELYRAWRCDVIGMTNMPEAKLAREAELCYATIAMVTDYDCWHPEHDAVTVDMVVRTVQANAGKARTLLKSAVPRVVQAPASVCPHGCQRALEYALITAPEARDATVMKTLEAVAGRVLE